MRFFVTVLFLILFGSGVSAFAADIETVDKDELKSMLGTADLVVLDVRAGRDWSSSEFKIKGAVREEPGDVEAWAGNYEKGKTIVLYCA
jgi:rhodanese-related sulfurtransferase